MNDRTEHEHAVLTRVREGLPAPLRKSIPEPRALVRWGGISVAVESCLRGVSLLRSSGSWRSTDPRRIDDLRAAAQWLAEFHAVAVVKGGTWNEAATRQWLDEPMTEYERHFGIEPAEAEFFAALRERAETLGGLTFPIVWHHRDYNVWNVLRDRNGVAVIDWEGARPGPPLVDLLHFATHWHESARRLRSEATQTAATRELWIGEPDAPLAAAVRTAVGEYLRRLSLHHRFVPILLGYLWIELAIRRARQQADLGAAPAAPRAGNRNFPFVAALAADRAALLETWE